MEDFNDFKVTALLCDHAQVADGKLFISGGGWSICGPGPFISALALKIDVPWSHADQQHNLIFRLLDSDGNQVMADQGAVEINSDFEVSRPTGLIPGATIDTPLAINIGPMHLESGQRYQWQIEINGEILDNLIFSVR